MQAVIFGFVLQVVKLLYSLVEGLKVGVLGHPWLLGKFAVCPGYMTPCLKRVRPCPQSYLIAKVLLITITTSCLHHKVICYNLHSADHRGRQEEYMAARAQAGMKGTASSGHGEEVLLIRPT